MSSYRHVSGRCQTQNNLKMVMVGLSLVMIAMMIGTARAAISLNNNGFQFSASIQGIDTICQPADYKQICRESLGASGNVDISNPRDIFKKTFSVTIDKVRAVMSHSQALKEMKHDLMTSKALDNCDELLEYAIDDLQTSLDNTGGFDISRLNNKLDDLRIWLSGAMTFQETCLDGFTKTKSHTAKSMRVSMNTSVEMTSNALAIVDGISSIIPKLPIPNLFGGRRLMADEDGDNHREHNLDAPHWLFSPKDRRRLLDAPANEMNPNVVVAKDGSGNYKTISEALKAVPLKSNTPFIIYVKKGLYKETVIVEKNMNNLVIVGDGPSATRITGNLNFADGTPTFQTATMAVVGHNFIGKNFGVENTAGPEKHQAVALRVQGDMSVFYNCQFDGYQDTLYVHTHRQFFRDCVISGTIDFIFGNSAVVLQNCLILVRKPMNNQQNIVTAQGRKDRREPTGIVLHNCTISADSTLEPVRAKIPSYLGRPWKEYSRTFIMQSQIDDLIHPDGWLPWNGDFALSTLFYTEFNNRGPGAETAKRVTWKGIKMINALEAGKYTVQGFIEGDRWLNPSGVPYTPGLLSNS